LAVFMMLGLAVPGTQAVGEDIDFTRAEPNEALSGGATTVFKTDVNAFSLPSANIPITRRDNFFVGNAFFKNPWVQAPSTTTARDGLGPLFNTNACQSCHIKDGRGHPPAGPHDDAVSMLVRLSIPAASGAEKTGLEKSGVVAEPVYGDQLQDFAIQGVAAEGRVQVRYQEIPVKFADGEVVKLRKPVVTISDPGYGPMHPQVMMSARVAQPMIGLGLLDAIAETDILAHADPEDMNRDGISGRANRVWDVQHKRTTAGRFGWKAGQPNVRQQSAGAFNGDIGITSSLFPAQPCTPKQTACRKAPAGGQPEVSDDILDFVTFYARNLAVPVRRKVDDPVVLKGKRLFFEAGCSSCHVPKFTTATLEGFPELSGQVIRPYTDLLLHDMGEGLADGRPEFLANGREWRTQPLWGIGLTQTVNGHTYFLHDGRARNLAEAILWHGGEAEGSKRTFLTMGKAERESLIAFLESL
jgi:CxxC motif-containing protein (DUF1111 family)